MTVGTVIQIVDLFESWARANRERLYVSPISTAMTADVDQMKRQAIEYRVMADVADEWRQFSDACTTSAESYDDAIESQLHRFSQGLCAADIPGFLHAINQMVQSIQSSQDLASIRMVEDLQRLAKRLERLDALRNRIMDIVRPLTSPTPRHDPN